MSKTLGTAVIIVLSIMVILAGIFMAMGWHRCHAQYISLETYKNATAYLCDQHIVDTYLLNTVIQNFSLPLQQQGYLNCTALMEALG